MMMSCKLRNIGKQWKILQCARFSSSISSSEEIRQQFLDFFVKENSHSHVPSSPVVPYGDPSLAFVNAGMNQFKPIFLGHIPSPYKRAANSQKCIRVGGKHNDLDDVGRDGYHHTFFEMLGSWSFNDYFKAEACSMAWQLLTQVYKIPPHQLFVTYFGGDKSLNLPADEECKEIWLSLGVVPENVLPFGMKENFWEMGQVGPCGPCSEIHVNKGNLKQDLARKLVNQSNEDVVEIWNLVFMQYNRISSDVLEKLPARHIDTGMGLERLVALLQQKSSNYDSDLFQPLINTIHQVSGGNPYRSIYSMETSEGQRDWAYRLLADHSRMITVALADGSFPDNNHRLRRVIRQAIVTSRKWFNQDASLLLELSRRVADMFCGVYPELGRNLRNVHTLLRFEEEVFRDNLSKSGKEWAGITSRLPELASLPEDQQPGLIAGLHQLEDWARSSGRSHIEGDLAFKLYNTYGLQEESLILLSRLKGWTVDWTEFQRRMEDARRSTLQQIRSSQADVVQYQVGLDVPPTEWDCQDAGTTRTENGEYQFQPLNATILALFNQQGCAIKEASAGERVFVVTDKSCFYYEAGGQVGDTGRLVCSTGEAIVEDVRRVGNHIHHTVRVDKGSIKADQPIELIINGEERVKTMSNHTATHLLQAALKNCLKVTCQKSSHVTPNHLRFDFGLFQSDFHLDMVSQAESSVRQWIKQGLSVDRLSLPLREAVADEGITLLPGEAYPDVVSLVRIPSISLEPCCGTHVRNTTDLRDFAILSLKSAGVGSRSLKAVTRSAAVQARLHADELESTLVKLEQSIQERIGSIQEMDRSFKALKSSVEGSVIPLESARQFGTRLEKLESVIRAGAQKVLATMMQEQVEEIVRNGTEPFVVLALSIPPELLDIGRAKLSLIKATRHSPKKPILVLAWDGKELIGRCSILPEFVKADFDAEKWCNYVMVPFGGKGSSPKGQDPRLAYNFRCQSKSEDAVRLVELANKYALTHFM